MASNRVSFSQYRLEAEIDRHRAECQWDKIPTIVEQLVAARFHEDDDYGTLLLAEALLEECLQDNLSLLRNATPLTDINQPKLTRSKGYLNSILSRGLLGPRHLNEALLLMAKIHYVQGDYRDAQGMCARVGIDELTGDEQPVYHLRLLAEAFVIKGLSLDHQAVSAASRVRLSEREEECLSCYLRACDTALVYLQELDKVCVSVCFCLLFYFFTPNADNTCYFMIQSCTKLLGVCVYQLKLLLGDAVISRVPDHKEAQETSLQDTTSVYDLLSIGMARRGQYAMLSECLERAMKFSFNEFHLWHQLGLSLMACGKGVGAVSVLKECARMRPEDPSLPMLAAKVCIGQLHWLEEAEALSQSVVSMGEEAAEFLPRAYLTVGLCCSLQASDATLKAQRDGFNRRALENLQKAYALDPNDAKIALYLSLQLALVRQVAAAMDPLRVALSLRRDDLHSLHLLTLLLSAQKHHQHALETLTLALSQHPENFNGPSLAASRLEQATSEVSAISSAHRQGPAYIWTTLEHIWLQAGELFMAEGRAKEAQFCVQEAAVLFPNSHSVLLLRARLAELKGNQDEAKSFYDEALAIHPNGHRILLHLLLVRCGRLGLGEKVLRDAVQAQSTSHEAWSGLGEALQSQGSSQAPDCFLTALELEASCPIRPFTIIPREL
uniref:Tetratricopeptide repeat domain 7A n=1 Tax=Salmo trutta TaxID=8032 RepID=A0A673VYK3_SALTR